MKCLISVGIPTFNRKKYLKEAIDSCLRQDVPEGYLLEIIISDNCSTDGTRELLSKYEGASKDRIALKIFYHNKPVSAMENWNATLAHATGDYFLLLSDDDKLDDGFYREVLDGLADSSIDDIDGILTGYKIINAESNVLKVVYQKRSVQYGKDFFFDLVTRKKKFHWCAFLSKRKLLDLHKVFLFDFPGSGMMADGAGILACCSNKGKVMCLSKPLVKYRIHGSNDCRQVDVTKNIVGREKFIEFARQIIGDHLLTQYVIYWCADGYFYQFIRWHVKRQAKRAELRAALEHMVELNDIVDWSCFSIFRKYGLAYKIMISKLLWLA